MASVLILGAGSDIAQAVARKFAKESFDIHLAARDINGLEAFRSDIQLRYNITCTLHVFDALAFDTHDNFFKKIVPMPGISVCVFGIMEDEERAFTDWNTCQRMINTNFTGSVSILNIIADSYRSNRSGVIVGISSVAGERGRQSKLIYGSTKAAFTTYLDGLRNKLFKDKVHVVTVKPGFVYTRLTEKLSLPPALTAKPEELGDAIYKAVRNKTNIIYVRSIWRWIMLAIRSIPEFQFKKMDL